MDQYSRRGLLGAVGTAGVVGLAGCLGGGSGSGGGRQRECSGEQRSVEVPPAGNPEAGVTVAAYTDFACPHCRRYMQNTYPGIERDYIQSGKIAYRHRDFPIPVDETWSWLIPNAAFAVYADTDVAGYYTFVERVFQYQGKYSKDTVTGVGTEAGARASVVRQALEREPFCRQINRIKQAAEERGVSATPTVFVNDRKLEAPSADDLRGAIESAL